MVAIDGSKFKAVNHRDRNFTSGKMQTRMALIEQSIVGYLEQLDRMDRRETPSSPRQTVRLKERIATLKDEMSRLEGLKARMEASPDCQVSLTDPDARSMASQGKGTGIVGHNVQTAVDTQRHLIVAHESKAAIHWAIWTNFLRPEAPALIETADLLHLKCAATNAINSAFAFPSTGGDFNFATHVPSAA